MNVYRKCLTLCVFLFLFIGFTGTFTRKEKQILGEKVHELAEMSSERAIIRLTGQKFHRYIKAPPRNYSFVVMLTALSRHRQCLVCGYAYDEFLIVANSWKYHRFNSKELFFGVVEFDEASDVFSSLRLDSAPVIMHFPEEGKPKTSDQMDIQRRGFQAETVARWISERTGIRIRVMRPPNHSAATVLVILFALLGTLLYKRRNSLDFLYNRTAYGFVALALVIIFASGQMWNHRRGPPFVHFSKEGDVSYVYSSNSGQYVAETYMVIFLYADIAVGMILMLEAGASRRDPKKRRLLAVFGLGVVIVSFGLVLFIFKKKMPSYPYSFLL